MRERQSVAIERVEIAHVTIQAARENRERSGVDFFRAEQRGKRVKIGVLVREDGVHGLEL